MITSKAKIQAAVDAALDTVCYGSQKKAIEHVARELCLPPESVYDAMQPEGWCCARGENLGVKVCEECA